MIQPFGPLARFLSMIALGLLLLSTLPPSQAQSDKAMDQFIAILVDHATSAPDASKLKAAYTVYLEKLKLAD